MTTCKPSLFATAVATGDHPSMAIDPKALGFNLVKCRACQGRWFNLACAAEVVQHFVAPRVITTLVAGMALWATIASWV